MNKFIYTFYVFAYRNVSVNDVYVYTYIQYVQYVQARHRDEIEQIRKAGHDSLAMIVEQYKVIE